MLISMTSLLTPFDNCIVIYDALLYSECTQKVCGKRVHDSMAMMLQNCLDRYGLQQHLGAFLGIFSGFNLTVAKPIKNTVADDPQVVFNQYP